LSSTDILWTGGGVVLQMRTSALWCKILRNFRNLWCVRTDKGRGGLSQCGHFVNKVVGVSIFRDFVQMSFLDGPWPELFWRQWSLPICLQKLVWSSRNASFWERADS